MQAGSREDLKAIWDSVAAWEVWWVGADLDLVELNHRDNNWKQLEASLLTDAARGPDRGKGLLK